MTIRIFFNIAVSIVVSLLGINCTAEVVAVKSVKQLPFKLVASYQHDSDYYTQGLEFYQGYLYESTGNYGKSKIIKYAIDPASGKTVEPILVKRIPKKFFAEGVSVVNNQLWMLTWQRQLLLKFSVSDFSLVDKPIQYSGQGWGLANTEDYIIRSDGSSYLTLHDSQTFDEVKKIAVEYNGVELDKINELEWFEPIAGKPPLLLANRWLDNRIYCIQVTRASARVIAVIDLSQLKAQQPTTAEVLNGIAWHHASRHLWVTGKYWNRFYELDIAFDQLY